MNSPLVVVLATRNPKKAREMIDLLSPLGVSLRSLAEFPDAPVVEETGTTFAENAAIKARETALATRHWALADDSGLVVDALRGAPGVHSARYAGADASDEQNNEKLLRELSGIPPRQRGARFVCNLALADPTGAVRWQVEGHCCGQVLEDHRGGEGFGYDPLFLIQEYGRTFGELGLAVKSCISHRARAFRLLSGRLPSVLAGSA